MRPGNRNIRIKEPIDRAAWLWHPAVAVDEPAFLRFSCDVESDGRPLRMHGTADQHFHLILDGKAIARGPARSDVAHWSYATYALALEPGRHVLEAEVWWIGPHAPMSIMSYRGGFALWAEAPYTEALSTGIAPWRVARRRGVSFTPRKSHSYVVIGDRMHTDAADWHVGGEEWTDPVVVRQPVIDNPHGVDRVGGWKCYPSQLPPLTRSRVTSGTIRAVVSDYEEGQLIARHHTQDTGIASWQALLTANTPVTVPPHTRLAVLWDLENYYAGFYELHIHGGLNSRLSCCWSEGLFAKDSLDKGDRGEIVGKRFVGYGDAYTPDGMTRQWQPYWVGSGRYLLLHIQTDGTPLQIDSWCVYEQRYPLESSALIDFRDEALNAVVPLCVRTLQACSHDQLMDCPHYEQLMYVGDSRLELLATYALTEDTRLAERSIALHDVSLRPFEFVAERYPSREEQCSTTYAAIWNTCLHDYAYWRDNPAWVSERLIGMHANTDVFSAYRTASHLVQHLPGWSFIDWVPGWRNGGGPGNQDGCCALSNLFYLLALQAAADLEGHYGSSLCARHYNALAKETGRAIRQTFWNAEQQAFADDAGHRHYSQHAQSLAVIAGLVPRHQRKRLMRKALTDPAFAKATIYFRYYLFEALYRSGLGRELRNQYALWTDLLDRGLFTMLEQNEPSRSDCHGWGAHAVHHMVASLAGVRPIQPGFKRVRIEPVRGSGLDHIQLELPHPDGRLILELDRPDKRWTGRIVLPPGCTGLFVDGSLQTVCTSGETMVFDAH